MSTNSVESLPLLVGRAIADLEAGGAVDVGGLRVAWQAAVDQVSAEVAGPMGRAAAARVVADVVVGMGAVLEALDAGDVALARQAWSAALATPSIDRNHNEEGPQ